MKAVIKFPVIIGSVALLLATAVGIGSYFLAAHSLQEISQNQLEAIAESRRDELASRIAGVETSLRSMSQSVVTRRAINELGQMWEKFGDKVSTYARTKYFNENTGTPSERAALESAGRSPYDKTHKGIHSTFLAYAQQQKYDDILIIDRSGNIVYSVMKSDEFARNIDELPGSPLAVAAERAIAGDEGAIYLMDFAPVSDPSAPLAMTASSQLTIGGKALGALVYRVTPKKFEDIFQRFAGLGATGDVIWIGDDGLARSDSARTPGISEVMNERVSGAVIERAVAGSATIGILPDFRGTSYLAAAAPLEMGGATFAIAAVQAENEALAAVTEMRNSTFMLVAIGSLLASVLGFALMRGMTVRMTRLATGMRDLASGNTDIELQTLASKDELGDIVDAASVFRDNLIERERLTVERQKEQERRHARQYEIDNLIQTFRIDIQTSIGAMGDKTADMKSMAQRMAELANDSAEDTKAAANASERASGNVQNVASAAEELSASVGEIARQVSTTTDVMARATTDAAATNNKISGLEEAAQKIGDVVSLISEIAEQTNLLALNATIEAARAGDAGRGFAVVASEVKQLAEQTAKATDEISTQIAAIQASTKEAVVAIGTITETMSEVNTYTSAIVGSVEQQGFATSDISLNAQEAASGTSAVSSNLTQVNSAVSSTAQSANDVLSSADGVADETASLKRRIDDFLLRVEAA